MAYTRMADEGPGGPIAGQGIGRAQIGVAISWPGGENYSQEIMGGIEEAAKDLDCDVWAFALRYARPEYPGADPAGMLSLDCLEHAPLDGLILVNGQEWVSSRPALAHRLPTISIVSQVEGIPCLKVDNAVGFNELLEHLFCRHGYRNPVFVSGPESFSDARERRDLFLSALRRHGIGGGEARIFYGEFLRSDGARAVSHFLEIKGQKPDVFVCANDHMALGVWHALLERGLRVPEEVAVTGFDDLPIFMHHDGPLSTVRQPIRELGRRAARCLHRLMCGQGQEGPCADGLPLPTQAVIRSSCGCASRTDSSLGAREMESILHREAMEGLAGKDRDNYLELRLSAFCADYIAGWDIAANAFREAELLKELCVDSFYIVIYDNPALAPAGKARLVVAWEDGKRLSLPDGGVAFDALRVLPALCDGPRRRGLCVEPLADHGSRFGLCILSLGAQGTNAYDKVMRRLAESIRAVRTARDFKCLSDKLEAARARLESLSISDELTGLYNRRGFFTLARQQIAYCRRLRQTLGVLYVDLDGLKAINDNWGHDSGDLAIRSMAGLLLKAFRSTDIVARMGGDEYTVLLPDVPPNGARPFLERLGQLVEEFNAEHAHPWVLAMSLGDAYASPESDVELDRLIAEADRRLYVQKRQKRGLRP